MDKKNIVVFFGKRRNPTDPFCDFGEKRAVYYNLFKCGVQKGFSMFLANGKDTYSSHTTTFYNPLLFNGKGFVPHTGQVSADAVLDRSALSTFPSAEISHRTLNPAAFKSFCASKIEMHKALGQFMPKTHYIYSQNGIKRLYQETLDGGMYALKPSCGLGGKGIIFGTLKKLQKQPLDASREYVLQQFVDTSFGIPGITDNRHDLRIVVIHNKIVWITLREPQDDKLLANVSQGGSIRDITRETLPENTLLFIGPIQAIIQSLYGDNLIYSIDIGVENGAPYIFEINDRIGYPTDTMISSTTFLNALLDQLGFLATKS